MWRSIASVILLPALAAGQNSPAHYLQGDLPRPKYGNFTEQQAVRQGTTERVDLFVSLGNAVVANQALSREVIPFKIEFDPADGIVVTSVSYPQHAMMRVALQNSSEPLHASLEPPVAVLNPPFVIRFKVKVSKLTNVGEHKLRGRITYQPIRADGVFAPQKMEIVVPITVDDRNTTVHRHSSYGHTEGFNIWLILLAPILIPLSILAALVGMDC